MNPISINAKGKPLGRLASRIAYILQGKHLPGYRPERREGPNVVVYNIDAVKLSGKKASEGVHRRHSGFPGGLKTISNKRLIERDPRLLVRMAVRGMLARNRLRARLLKKMTLIREDLRKS
ncbi:MAG: 50S ribosomal protein L13 [bacterium]|nr:50S ribosomal protein L13 [bacterium]